MNRNHDSNDANRDANPGCDKFADELTHLVLGELEPARAADVESHCASCAACRAERELLAKSAAMIEADAPKLATVMRLSEAREQALLAQAAAGGALPQKFWTFQRLSAAAAAILTVCVTGNWLWRKYDIAPGRPESEVASVTSVRKAVATKASDPASTDDDKLALTEQQGRRMRLAVGESGEVTFSRSEPGEWNLWVQSPGYYKYSAKLSLEAGKESVHEAELVTLQSGPPQGEATPAQKRGEPVVGNDKLTPEEREALQQREETDSSLSTAALLRVVVRDANGNIVPQANVSLFKGDSPLANAKKIVKSGMVGLKLPDSDEQRSGMTTTLTDEERAAMSALGYGDAGADEDNLALAEELRSLGYIEGEEAAIEESQPAHHGTGTPSPVVRRKAGAGRAGNTQLTEEELARLDQLGYGDGGGSEFESRQQIGNHLYTDDDTASGATSSVAITREEVLEKQKELEALGYAAESIPVPAVGGISGSPTPLFDDDLADDRWSTAIPAAIAAASFHTPREVAALEEQLRRAAAAGRTIDVDALVKSFLDRLAPRQGEAPRDMFFRWFGDNPAIPTRIDARSTFGMDVDTASYNLARGYLAKGTLPPKAAVRTEEFVNAFKQGLAAPAAAVDGVQNPDVFALTTELAPSPFGEGKQLLRIGLKAREIDRAARAPASLTFVIDVSGSMEEGGRLELVKQALRLLVAQLDERDSIAIVVFSENARIALPPTRASEQAKVLAALDPLRPENSTNAGAGLRLGYDLAMTQRDRAGDHRVILCSDGVANAGVTDPDQLTTRIRQCKSERIYLTTVGVGMNNVNDALLEQLAREGDGNCHYVDGLAEAKELFVDKLTGTLSTVARDAKIQVEFAPESVRAFRQLGYENRALAHADFRNDKVDAGEVGAGHEVVALYELDLAPNAAGPIATVHCRYEEPRSQTVREQARVCFAADAAPTVAAASPNWRLDAAVAEFAELLRQSVHARDGSFGAIERLAEPLVAELADDKDVPEFVALVKQAARLPDLLPRRGELSRCVDELKKVRCWQQELGQVDPAQKQANGDLMRQLEEQNRKLEQALRDALAGAAKAR